jgi:hypothetical protein
MRAQALTVAVVMAVFSISSKGSAATAMSCEGTGDQTICMSLPADAPESSIAAAAPIQEPMPLIMGSNTEISGEAADFAVLADLDIGPTTSIAANPSLNDRGTNAAAIANERAKLAERFLRSSGRGDSLVTVANHDKKK